MERALVHLLADPVIPAHEGSSVTIQNETEPLGPMGAATLHVRFPAGTRCKPGLLRVRVPGVVTLPDGSQHEITLVSKPSNPFIITTNECQWEGAEGKLFRWELFGPVLKGKHRKSNRRGPATSSASSASSAGPVTASWPSLANGLRLRFLRATRQEMPPHDMVRISGSASTGRSEALFARPMGPQDMEFVHSTFFDHAVHVTEAQFNRFWSWFGKTMHIYRHNASLRQLFLDGLFYGMVSKEEAERLLQGATAGSFLVRNALSKPGELALAFVGPPGSPCRHFRIDSKKILPPHNTLPDYLRGIHSLVFLLKPYHWNRARGAMQPGAVAQPKHQALAPYYSHSMDEDTGGADDGYEMLDALHA